MAGREDVGRAAAGCAAPGGSAALGGDWVVAVRARVGWGCRRKAGKQQMVMYKGPHKASWSAAPCSHLGGEGEGEGEGGGLLGLQQESREIASGRPPRDKVRHAAQPQHSRQQGIMMLLAPGWRWRRRGRQWARTARQGEQGKQGHGC